MKILKKIVYYLKKEIDYLKEDVPYNSAGCWKTGHTYQYASCPFTGKTYGDCTSCGDRTVKDTQASIV